MQDLDEHYSIVGGIEVVLKGNNKQLVLVCNLLTRFPCPFENQRRVSG